MTDLDLTSPKGERVAEVRRLHDRRHRAQRGAFVVEGPAAVEAALARGVLEIYATQQASGRHAGILRAAQQQGARVWRVADAVLDAMAETQHPQGLLAVCPLITVELSQALSRVGASATSCLVILDRVNDPGNAGTIIRTADAMGASAVILTEGSVDPHNGKCVRATAGSLFHLPIAADQPLDQVREAVRAAGLALVTADARGSLAAGTAQAQAVLSTPVAWVFGNEAHGVALELSGAAHASIAIPQYGGAESLNLAAAAAICLYETARAQRAV